MRRRPASSSDNYVQTRGEEGGDSTLLLWSVELPYQQHWLNYCVFISTGAWMTPFHTRGSVITQDVPAGVMRSQVETCFTAIRGRRCCLLNTSRALTAATGEICLRNILCLVHVQWRPLVLQYKRQHCTLLGHMWDFRDFSYLAKPISASVFNSLYIYSSLYTCL